MDVRERTTIAAWLIQVSAAFDELYPSVGAAWALNQAKVDLDLLRDPNARIPSSQLSRFYEVIEAATGDKTIGLRVADYLTPVSLHALGYSVLASSDLNDFFKHLSWFFTLISDCGFASIELSQETLSYSIEVSEQRPPAREDSFVAAVVKFARMVHKPNFVPHLIRLRRSAADADVAAFEAFFGCPVEFGHSRPEIQIARGICDEPLRGANPDFVRRNDQLVIDYLARSDTDPMIMRIERIVRSMLPGNPSLMVVARELGMSDRALQRHLKSSGTSFADLLNSARQELALEYLKSRSYSIKEVSYLLGYSEPGNFSRAFRRSHGLSPLEYCSSNGISAGHARAEALR